MKAKAADWPPCVVRISPRDAESSGFRPHGDKYPPMSIVKLLFPDKVSLRSLSEEHKSAANPSDGPGCAASLVNRTTSDRLDRQNLSSSSRIFAMRS